MCLPDLPRGSEFNDDDKDKPATRTVLTTDKDDEGDVMVRHRGGFPYRFSRAKFEIPSYFAPLELDFVAGFVRSVCNYIPGSFITSA